jgi:putative spermidine/putrescine transport system permease protein
MPRDTRWRRPAYFSLLIAPGLICFISLFVAPLSRMVSISFAHYSASRFWVPGFTLENYARFFANDYYLRVAARTLYLSLLTTCSCIVLGYPFAYFLNRTSTRRLGIYYFVLISPLMMSSVVLVFGWVSILGPQGPVVALLRAIGLPPVKLLYTEAAIVIGLTELLLPFMVFPLMSAIESIHPSLEEAAQNLGAGRVAVFWRVILPMSRPGLVSGCLLVYSMALGSLIVPALLGAPSDTMLGGSIYNEVMNTLNWPFASAMGLLLLVGTGLLMMLYLTMMRASTSARAGIRSR